MIFVISNICCSYSFYSFHTGSINNYVSRQSQNNHSVVSRSNVNIMEYNYLLQSLNLLHPQELNVLYNVIDKHLIEDNDDHYLLLKELGRSIDNFEKILELKKRLLTLSKKSGEKLNMSDEVLDEINNNKKYIYDKGMRLKSIGGNYINLIKKRLKNSNLSENKIGFYVFVLDFVTEIFDFMVHNTHNCHVKLHYCYIINQYETYEYCMQMLIEDISLPNILYHTEQCLREETNVNKSKKIDVLIELRYLIKNIRRFYENIENYLLRIRKILNLIKECMNKSNCNAKPNLHD
ncbi:uncharacterized protein VNE69_11135 [Vairimorpha necatrix]|uniref:Uncharacterized protein n=1 Tax=Vairimorpha necatrix TaxID=6039 RepID=A0AAX4JG56_9MICR